MSNGAAGGDRSAGVVSIINKVLAGGLPQVIAGPAGVALARLIGGVAEIPAAYLERYAQSVRDETTARSAILKTIADAAGASGSEDRALVLRALNRYVPELYRRQQNRETVAGMAYESLRLDPQLGEGFEPSSFGIDNDWLDRFARHVEEVSTEEVQRIWAEVLAGEIKKPGSYSLRTLNFLSMVDKSVARAIEKVLQFVLIDFISVDLCSEVLSGEEFSLLHEAGFLSSPGPLGSAFNLTPGTDGWGAIIDNEVCFLVESTTRNGEKMSLTCYSLTKSGLELSRTLMIARDYDRIGQSLFKFFPSPGRIMRASVKEVSTDFVKIGPKVEIVKGI